jgi:galactokinase
MTDARKIAAMFDRRFGGVASVYRAPGRINIIGGHSDYNDGFVLPTTTALYTWLAIAPRTDSAIRVYSANFDEEASFQISDIRRSSDNHWSDYIKGVVHELVQEEKIDSGFDIVIDGQLPVGGGLSSSASLETVVAYAILDSAEQDIDRRDLALLCQRAEVEFVGARCGIMDQYAISCGESAHATMLDCRSLEHRLIPLPGTLRILVVDTGVEHQLAAGGFNRRREECQRAVETLAQVLPGVRALRDVSMAQLEEHRLLLDDVLYRRSRHIVSEITRVHNAATALSSGDVATVGQLIGASHKSLRDDYEVSCPEMETLVGIISNCDGSHGARLVGAGFGGCAISIVEPAQLQNVMDTVSANYGTILGHTPWMHVIEASGPVDKVDVHANSK